MGNIKSKRQIYLKNVKKILMYDKKSNIYNNEEFILLDVCIRGSRILLEYLFENNVYNCDSYSNRIMLYNVGKIYFLSIISDNSMQYITDTVKCLLNHCTKYNLNICNDNIIMRFIEYKCFITNIQYNNIIETCLKLFLEYRYAIQQSFDLKEYEGILYNCIIQCDNIQIAKIVFDYGEKMNYKLNITKLYPKYDRYVLNLIKHNYGYFKYDKNNNILMNNPRAIKTMRIYKTPIINEDIYRTKMSILHPIYYNTYSTKNSMKIIQNLDIFHEINYILCIPYMHTEHIPLITSYNNKSQLILGYYIYNNNFVDYGYWTSQ